MKIEQQADGSFAVISANGDVVQVFRTNAEAWRWLDRHDDYAAQDQDRDDRIARSINQW